MEYHYNNCCFNFNISDRYQKYNYVLLLQKKEDRIYSWAVTKSLDVYGHKDGECPEKLQNTHGVFTYDVCLCTCETNYVEKDRYFCLQNVEADSAKNK